MDENDFRENENKALAMMRAVISTKNQDESGNSKKSKLDARSFIRNDYFSPKKTHDKHSTSCHLKDKIEETVAEENHVNVKLLTLNDLSQIAQEKILNFRKPLLEENSGKSIQSSSGNCKEVTTQCSKDEAVSLVCNETSVENTQSKSKIDSQKNTCCFTTQDKSNDLKENKIIKIIFQNAVNVNTNQKENNEQSTEEIKAVAAIIANQSSSVHELNPNDVNPHEEDDRIDVTKDDDIEVGKSSIHETSTENIENIIQCESLDVVEHLIHQHEEQLNIKFSLYYCGKSFGKTDIYLERHKIYWQHDVDSNFFYPYMVLNSKVYDCCYGKDRNVNAKEKKRKKRDQTYINYTKKVNCPAAVKIKEICIFPDYKLPVLKKRSKDGQGKLIRHRMNERDESLEAVRKFLVSLPEPEDHKYHSVGLTKEELKLEEDELHPFLIERIQDLVKQGNTSVLDIKRLLKIAVEDELFQDSPSPRKCNRKYFPQMKTVRKYMEPFLDHDKNGKPKAKRKKRDDEIEGLDLLNEDEDIETCVTEEVIESNENINENNKDSELMTEQVQLDDEFVGTPSEVTAEMCREKLRQIYELTSSIDGENHVLQNLFNNLVRLERSILSQIL